MKKSVFITGAGRGLGKAITQEYLKAGFFVIASDINIELLTYLKKIPEAHTMALDVTSEPDVKRCADHIQKEFGPVSIVISNAGIFDFYPVSESGSEKINKIFAVNVLGLTNLTKYFLSQLNESKGRLIVIGSESYKVPSPFQPYSVSKQALESVYNAIKIELALKDIQCVLIRPGAMQTKILEDTIKFNNFEEGGIFEIEFRKFVSSVPKYIRNIASPEEVAALVLKAGTVINPKSVYHINHNVLVTILSLLPAGLKNFIIRKDLKN